MSPTSGQYTLATGVAAARRLHLLHNAYGPVGRRVLEEAGVGPGMRVADFGCGVGATSGELARLVGPGGHVTGIDYSGAQCEQARQVCAARGITNATFVEASAYATGLPRASFDAVYCRFLLLHLTDPGAALREMREVLKPGGILVVEDGNLLTAGSMPPGATQAFVDLFGRLAAARNLNYGLADNLFQLVRDAGFPEPDIFIHQPAFARGDEKLLAQLSVVEIGPACVQEGLLTQVELDRTLADMERDALNPDVLVICPRMSLVWARKPQ